jgi:phospholipase/carboxylesterase
MTLTHRSRPAAGDPEGALVLFHGRGADENDLFPLLDVLDPERKLAGFTPRGPLSLPPGGAHWYALGGLGTPEPQTFAAGYGAAQEWLDGLGFPPERTVIGGFSQGAVLSYALGLDAARQRPAALTAFSGFLPSAPGLELDLEHPPPAAIGHGTYDDVIPVEFGRRAHELLPHALYAEYPLGHTLDLSFLEEVRLWLTSVLSSAPISRTPSS